MTGTLLPEQFRDVDGSGAPALAAAYLERVAAEPAAVAYKKATLAALGDLANASVLDVGCGTGVDLPHLSRMVGDAGRVVGMDLSEELVARARERIAGLGNAAASSGDAHQLPFADDEFDAARIDRVLLHVERPEAVVREMARVVRPGGRVVASEGDWGTLVVAPATDGELSLFSRGLEGVIRHPFIGRDLPAHMLAAGIDVVDVLPASAVFRTLEAADALLQLRALAGAAVAAQRAAASDLDAWSASAREASDAGSFLASLTGFITVGVVA